jgi:hypothetical protein
MFRPRLEPGEPHIEVFVDGKRIRMPEGASAAAAVLAAGFDAMRETPVTGSPRGPWCLMGICFDCLAEIDDVPNRQACLIEVRPGMRIRRQRRARHIQL